MSRNHAVVLALVVTTGSFFAGAARADDCPQILNFGILSFEQHFDTDLLPDKTPQHSTYIPIVAMHVVSIASPLPIEIQDKAWCNVLTGDSISLSDSLLSQGVAEGNVSGVVSDGSFVAYALGSTPESVSQDPRSGSSLLQMGYRDVIHVGGSGTDPIPITLHRSINGSWTSTEGHGNTLYWLGSRTFTMTIHDFPTPNILTGVTRSLVIDDTESVGFLNGEQDYVFDAIPGHTLVLTLYLEAGVECSPFRSFGQPPVVYNGCFGYVDFGGDQFGAPIGLSFSSPPGNPLSADSGYQYVPEPGGGEPEAAAFAGLAAIGALVARQRRTASRNCGNTFDTFASR